jgi:hypothetical protein
VGGTCGTHGGGERCSQGFDWEVRKEEPLGRPRHRCEDNVKMDLGREGDSASSG